jgi:CheY-like chemotaxis protein
MPGRAVTVLVVDDYADARTVWAEYLHLAGFAVLTAADGPEALATVQATPPDVILLDLEMPGMSGLDVAAELKANPDTRQIPLIATTGHSLATHGEKATKAGFACLLVKPCEPNDVIAEIRRLVATAPPQAFS